MSMDLISSQCDKTTPPPTWQRQSQLTHHASWGIDCFLESTDTCILGNRLFYYLAIKHVDAMRLPQPLMFSLGDKLLSFNRCN